MVSVDHEFNAAYPTQVQIGAYPSHFNLRLYIVFGITLFGFLLLIARLSWVMLWVPYQTSNIQAYGPAQLHKERGDILDRNNEIIATNLTIGSLYANPKEILDIEEAVTDLHGLFPDLKKKELRKKLSKKTTFVWLKRHLKPAEEKSIYQLGLPGLYVEKEKKRIYPFHRASGHIIGYTNIDLEGVAGIERAFNDRLLESDAPLKLTLDMRVQTAARDALLQGVEKFRAIGGSALVVDIQTGDILGAISLPDYNPHQPGSPTHISHFNRNTLGVYEMGSIFKIITLAAGLDAGVVQLTDTFDVRKPIKIGRFRINDFRGKNRILSLPEVIMYSSNIGTIMMQEKIGQERQEAFFQKLGLLDPVPFSIKEQARPLYPAPWTTPRSLTAAYGYGIAVTPLHIARAIGALVNGGKMFDLNLISKDGAQGDTVNGGVKAGALKPVIKRQTSQRVRRFMHLVAKKGTARKTYVKGYVVGSKTGSANKQSRGGYRNEHLASAVVAFPMTKPKYLVFCSLDEPKGNAETFGFATGGWTAAPVAREIIKQIGPMLGVIPVDETDKKIQNALYLNTTPGNENAEPRRIVV